MKCKTEVCITDNNPKVLDNLNGVIFNVIHQHTSAPIDFETMKVILKK
jgi:hypothetical protein